MINLKILTNHLPNGWCPSELKISLGGEEECVVYLAEHLSHDYEVTVYLTKHKDTLDQYKKVRYLDRSEFSIEPDDILIAFKAQDFLRKPVPKCRKIIYWSSDVELPFNLDSVDKVIHSTPYHRTRNLWVPNHKSEIFPLGIEKELYIDTHKEKEPNTLLYCSSPDRGLIKLLQDWRQIQATQLSPKLYVTYGFKQFDNLTQGNPDAGRWKHEVVSLLDQPNIEYLGALSQKELASLYKKVTYWTLPLERGDNELFCLNAVKARIAGAKPIIINKGGLTSTVKDYLDYEQYVSGHLVPKTNPSAIEVQDWSEIVEIYWKPLLKG